MAVATPHSHATSFNDDLAPPRGLYLLMQPFVDFAGTAADDNFSGGAGSDTFNMADGGNDTVNGHAGADTFNFGAEFTSADTVIGGGGNDVLALDGNYAGGRAVVFGATTMTGIDTMLLSGGSYDLTMNDASVATDALLTIDSSGVGAARTFTFDGSVETDGAFHIEAGSGGAFLTGGAQSDTFSFGDGFNVGNRIDGGGGVLDTLELNGDYAAGLVFQPGTIARIDRIALDPGHSYSLTLDNGNATIGQLLIIDATLLGSGDQATIDGSDETSAALKFEGGAGQNVFVGGGGNDTFRTGGGANIISGGAGDDGIFVVANFALDDQFDGGAGTDTVFLPAGTFLTLGASTIHDIERLVMVDGTGVDDYLVTLNAGNVGFGQALTVDGSALEANDFMFVDASAVIDGKVLMIGGPGRDTFILSQSGQDVVRGGGGADTIIADANLQATDRIQGSDNNDTLLRLSGDYSDRLEFDAHTIKDIQQIVLGAGHTYNLATADGNVAAGRSMDVDGSLLGASDRLLFDGSKESNGRLGLHGGAGNDVLIGGAGNDFITTGAGTNTVDASHGGSDTITGGAGNDTFIFGAAFDNADVVNPGAGTDTLTLDGDYGSATFKLPVIDIVKLAVGHDYNLAATPLTGSSMSILASHLGVGDALTFSAGSATGNVVVNGGAGNDTIFGGAAIDTLTGNAGDDRLKGGGTHDVLSGGAGKDTFIYGAASDSTSIAFDSVVAANFTDDKFDVTVAITHIETAVSGSVSNTSAQIFDNNIASAVNATFGAGEAILLTANAGTLNGHKFLIVDLNGTAGYQTGGDLVIDVTGSTGSLDIGDFV